jgi:hypothetical protein
LLDDTQGIAVVRVTQEFDGPVGRSVVYDDNLERVGGVGLANKTSKQTVQTGAAVVGGNDDADKRLSHAVDRDVMDWIGGC